MICSWRAAPSAPVSTKPLAKMVSPPTPSRRASATTSTVARAGTAMATASGTSGKSLRAEYALSPATSPAVGWTGYTVPSNPSFAQFSRTLSPYPPLGEAPTTAIEAGFSSRESSLMLLSASYEVRFPLLGDRGHPFTVVLGQGAELPASKFVAQRLLN